MMKIYTITVTMAVFIAISCEQSPKSAIASGNSQIDERAILETIQNETKAAFSRDYEAWKTHWIQDPKVSKTYMNFVDSTFSETIGWKEIDTFVKTYFKEHPEPVPSSATPKKLEISVYGNGAWVSYEIMDEVFGLKRETRLMEKENGEWKIAGLHTSIYGFMPM